VRTLYSLAVYLLTPFILLHFVLRGLRNRDYLRRWRERFACYRGETPAGGIVVHAVSVGEAIAAAPLIRALTERFPALPMTVTCFTPTGSDRIHALFQDRVFHVYAPLDLPGAVRRFLERVQPRLIVIMETEIWPNLFITAARRGVPVLIANARISQTSVGGYRRIRPLTRAALAQVPRIAAQSEQDAARLCDIGADPARVEVIGNLKFDLNLPPGLHQEGEVIRDRWGRERPVLLAGSTHEGDEAPVIEAFRQVLESCPRALLVLVPRHTERFARAAQAARAAGLETRQLSEGAAWSPSIQCFVVDAMGELLRYYAACDVAFVGGSFDRVGGHNVLEPSALAKPVLVGPHTFNFEEITEQLVACGGARRVADAAELARAAIRLLGDPALRAQMGAAGMALVRRRQGALARTLEIASDLLGPEPREHDQPTPVG
jgi:3-deoxy-D-manno-octulosonic-acid transferase